MNTLQKILVKLAVVLIAFFSSEPAARAQQIGHTTVTFTDSTRNNRQIPAEVYYPSSAAGDNTPILLGNFPLIVYGHGFLMTWSAYQNIWTDLVTQGYIVVFPKTEGGFAPQHAEFGKDISFLISYIPQYGASSVVPASSVSGRSAIMGHSMGGGSGFLAAEMNTSATTLVTFAAANTNPSSIEAARKLSLPMLVFSGSNDCVAPPAQHQNIMYDSAASEYKTQIYIKGGGHCFFADNNINCSLGESTCTPTPTISRAQQQSATSDLMKLWLGYFLKDDIYSALRFQDSLNSSSRITFRQKLPLVQPVGIPKSLASAQGIAVYLNRVLETVRVESKSEPISTVTLVDAMGSSMLVYDSHPSTEVSFDISMLKAGIYSVIVNKRHCRKLLVN